MGVLKEGDRGPKVKALQETLNKAGGRLKIQKPAVYDADTKAFVTKLQKQWGQPAVGLATDHFQKALDIAVNNKAKMKPNAPDYKQELSHAFKLQGSTDKQLASFRTQWPKDYEACLKKFRMALSAKVHPLTEAVDSVRGTRRTVEESFEKMAREIIKMQGAHQAIKDPLLKANLAGEIDAQHKKCDVLRRAMMDTDDALAKAIRDTEAKLKTIFANAAK